jgi:hypothetical protein
MKHGLNKDSEKTVSMRVNITRRRLGVGKGGCEIKKWCSFSHLKTALTRLFPHKSTQVVDFPHLAMVSQAELGTNVGKAEKKPQRQAKLTSKVGRVN